MITIIDYGVGNINSVANMIKHVEEECYITDDPGDIDSAEKLINMTKLRNCWGERNAMSNEYKMCTRCVMDTTDPEITFDENGYCNHCRRFFDEIKDVKWLPNDEGKQLLENMLKKIKEEGINKKYDGIIGLSGGIDSSYLLVKMKEWGLRPLAVHVDGGWNSEQAVRNIEVLCKKLNIDLFTIVINWEEMRKLQVAFLKSGVENQDIPQDHAFFAGLYRFAVKNGVRYVFNGSNFATESILPSAWGFNAMDSRYLKEIYRRFGGDKLKTFPIVSFFEYYIYYPHIRNMKVVKPLNYIEYSQGKAIKMLEEEYAWRYYGAKHWESRFTKFFQGYYLPTRFGYDKRKAHLSSLIVSGEISRDEAIRKLDKPIYPPEQFEEDKLFILKKLGIIENEFEALVLAPRNTELIQSNEMMRKTAKKIVSTLKRKM